MDNCIARGSVHSYEIVWGNAKREEGKILHLWQCTYCQKIVMSTDENIDREEEMV